MSFDVLLNHENLLFHMLDMCLFNLFWLSPYDDVAKKAEFRHAPPTGSAIVIEEGIFSMCSSLTKIQDLVIGRRLFCLTDSYLWNECVLNLTGASLIPIFFGFGFVL